MDSIFPNRTKPPGLNDRLKLWWAKEITPDHHIAGRLSERQIRYAAEGGFKSVLSLFAYGESGDFGGDYLPTTMEAKKIAEEICGIRFAVVLNSEDDWCSVDAVKKLALILPVLPTPILLFCEKSDAVAFVLLMHFAYCTRENELFEPKINSRRFYKIAANLGFNFTKEFQRQIVSEITGEQFVSDPPRSHVQPETWFGYWPCHPVYANWYISGQISQSHIKVLENAGFKSVINVRPGLRFNGEPSQEEVNLLNIRENTGTYEHGDITYRQSEFRLQETRVDPGKPNSYVGDHATRNYESRNEDEFGDDVGFNETLEKKAFEKSSLNYYHYPVLSQGPWEEYFDQNLEYFLNIGREGAVLVQCARATPYLAILCASVANGLSLEYALQKARDLGFAVTKENNPQMYHVFVKYLAKKT